MRSFDEVPRRPPPVEEIQPPTARQAFSRIADCNKPHPPQGIEDLTGIQNDLGDLYPVLAELPGAEEKTDLAGDPFVEHIVVGSRVQVGRAPAHLAPGSGIPPPFGIHGGPDLLRPGLIVEEDDSIHELLEHIEVVGGLGRDPPPLIQARQDGERKYGLQVRLPELLNDGRRDIDDVPPKPAAEEDSIDLHRIQTLDPGHHLLDIDDIHDIVRVQGIDGGEEDPGRLRQMAELHEGIWIDIDRYHIHATDPASPVMVVEDIHNP